MSHTTFAQGYACIIGVGADLPNTEKDAIGLADILKDPARCAYPPEQVHLLTGETANRANILSCLDNLAGSTNAQSTIIVYFSGHGYRINGSTGELYYLMPYGYNLNYLEQTAISGAEFTIRLQAIPAQKLLVLLDCCHAGGMSNIPMPLAKSPLPLEAQQMLSQGRGRAIIASSQGNELSYAGRPYSAFTAALLEAFCGQGVSQQDGYVRVTDLALHTREVVPRRTRDKQHPILNYEQADNFVLAYYAGGEAQPKRLPFEEPEIESSPGEFNRQIISGDNIGRDRTVVKTESSGTAVGTFNNRGSGNVHLGGQQHYGDVVSGDKIGGDKFGGDKVSGSKITVGTISNSTGFALGDGVRVISSSTGEQLLGSNAQEAKRLEDSLKQLQSVVLRENSGLSQKNQDKALKHLKVVGNFGGDRQNLDLKEQAETALDALSAILSQDTLLNKTQIDNLIKNVQEILDF
ncbi:MAG: caspase family protein [Scytonema sp. PMC 1070.18]|nr:caspase family protein [Scytonema sp. PMC 1070.18]